MKKFVSLALAAATLATLVGCGSTSTESQQTSENAQGTQKTLKIITWSNEPTLKALDYVNQKYMEKYPDVKIVMDVVETNQYTNLYKTRMQANDVDILSFDGAGKPFQNEKVDWAPGAVPEWQETIEAGNFVDLTDEPWMKNWSQGAIDNATFQGRTYGVSIGVSVATGVFYNVEMFEEHGWEVPKTWDEFVALCDSMKAAGVTPMTCGGADGWSYDMLTNYVMCGYDLDHAALSKGLWTGERKFNDEQSLEVYRRLDYLNSVMEPGFLSIPYSSAPGRFVTGKAAMLPDGYWMAPAIAKVDPEFEFGYFPFPGNVDGEPVFEGKYDNTMGINANSSNIEEAKNWFAMLSDPAIYTEFVNTSGHLPTQPDIEIRDEMTAALVPFAKNVDKTWALYYRKPAGVGEYAAANGYNGRYLASAGGPVATVEELADLTQKDFEAAVDAAWKANG